MPVGENITAIEAAIYECACAGCESIWITVDDNWMPLIKDRVGDFILDPVWSYRHHDPLPYESQKAIPIFLVPHYPRYLNRRDSLGWGIINSAIYAHKSTKRLSNFITPNLFYGTFVFGLHDPRSLIKIRTQLSSHTKSFIRHDGLTVKEDLSLPFTFDWEDVKAIDTNIRKTSTGKYKQIGEYVPSNESAWLERLPVSERYSAKNFKLSEVFRPLDTKDACFFDTEWYNSISTWDEYKAFLGRGFKFRKPKEMTNEKLFRIIDNEHM
tara:strand:- start:5567 stop:6370 length:804 start_codon:yes stop_codon:yes gene_type:complete